MKQVNREAYSFGSYTDLARWASYHYQIDEVLIVSPRTVLEIGGGDGVLRSYLKENTDIAYTSVDTADDLIPDVVGSVLKLPFADASFDLVCAFEVLEHLPFEQFEIALKEIARVSKTDIMISLPHFGPQIKFSLKVPFLREFRWSCKIPFPKEHLFNGQHYWEIGKKGFSYGKIVDLLSEHLDVMRHYVPFENGYHHFFIGKKKNR